MAQILETILSVVVDVLLIGTGRLILGTFGMKSVSETSALVTGLAAWLLTAVTAIAIVR